MQANTYIEKALLEVMIEHGTPTPRSLKIIFSITELGRLRAHMVMDIKIIKPVCASREESLEIFNTSILHQLYDGIQDGT